jgi:sugar lactone lactonase YvrE
VLRLKASLVLDSGAKLGEGLQLFPDGDLRWVDLTEGKIFRFDGKANILLHSFDHEVSRAVPARQGTIALGRYGPIAIDQSDQVVGALEFLDFGSNLRLSDGAVLPDGSLAVGIVDRELVKGRGKLVQITNELEILEVVSGATIPNGCGLLPSGQELAWVDSPTQTLSLLAWNEATGILGPPRPLASIPTEYGVPDGLCVDSQGGIWVAMWGGGKVLRFSPAGQIDLIVEVGTPFVTSCSFDQAGNLMISTASITIDKKQRPKFPGAGGIWMLPADQHGYLGQSVVLANLSQLFS